MLVICYLFEMHPSLRLGHGNDLSLLEP
jgi:hypothetical protein